MSLRHESSYYNGAPGQTNTNRLFVPTAADIETFGEYGLFDPRLIGKPDDILSHEIAYNPSGIYTIPPNALDNPTNLPIDVMYVRVEPNRVDSGVSHLGKTVSRPYIVDLKNPSAPLLPFHGGMELRGEDPSLLRINRRSPVSGKTEQVWLVSVVNAQPNPDKPYEVASVDTDIYVGESLGNLQKVAQGPPGMKDIRFAVDANPDSTKLHVWGRPQPRSGTGNVNYLTVPDISKLTPDSIAQAPLIHPELFPEEKGAWGGVNDAFLVGVGKYVLASHRAWMTGEDDSGRHYEACLFGHDTSTGRIVDLGVIATADMFPGLTVKDDTTVDLHDVVFTGGGYNGKPALLTFGVGDGSIGIGNLQRKPPTLRSV